MFILGNIRRPSHTSRFIMEIPYGSVLLRLPDRCPGETSIGFECVSRRSVSYELKPRSRKEGRAKIL